MLPTVHCIDMLIFRYKPVKSDLVTIISNHLQLVSHISLSHKAENVCECVCKDEELAREKTRERETEGN